MKNVRRMIALCLFHAFTVYVMLLWMGLTNSSAYVSLNGHQTELKSACESMEDRVYTLESLLGFINGELEGMKDE